MKAMGIDSCIVLRLLIGEPAAQAERARRFLEDAYNKSIRICVCDLTVAECYHALIHHYKVPKSKAVRVLREFLESPMIDPTGNALVVLSGYKGSGAGLVDRLIRMSLLKQVPEIATFDRSFARLDNVRLV